MSRESLFNQFSPSEELIALMRDFTHECMQKKIRSRIDLIRFGQSFFAELADGKRAFPAVDSLLLSKLTIDTSDNAENANQPAAEKEEDHFSRDNFLTFVNRILEAEDLIDVQAINDACDAASLPPDARSALAAVAAERERNRDDIIVLAATLASSNFVTVIGLLFQAFAGETGLLPMRDLIDLHQTLMSFKPKDDLLLTKYGAAIYNQLLSMTFDTVDLTFEQFCEMPIVQEYLEKRRSK